jgi:signal peptidase I
MRTFLQLAVWGLGILGIVALLAYYFSYDVWTLPSDDPLFSASVQPTLGPGDVVLLTRHPVVSRGNLLRCPDPEAPGRFVVARAIGAGGDNLLLENDTITVDGHHTSSPHACPEPKVVVYSPSLNENLELDCATEEYGDATYSVLRSSQPEPSTRAAVEKGKWYLVSDDRHVHLDSREYGPLDVSTCEHIVFRLVGGKGWSDWSTRLTILW